MMQNKQKSSQFKLSKRDQFKRDIRNKQNESVKKSTRLIDRAKMYRQRLNNVKISPEFEQTLKMIDEIIVKCDYQQLTVIMGQQNCRFIDLLDCRIYQIIENMIVNKLSDPRTIVLMQIILQSSQTCVFAFYDSRIVFKIVQEIGSLGKNKKAVSIYLKCLVLLTNQTTLIIEDQVEDLQMIIRGYDLNQWGQSKLLIMLILNLAKLGFFSQNNQAFLTTLCQQFWKCHKLNQINIYAAIQQIVQKSFKIFSNELSTALTKLFLHGSQLIPIYSTKRLIETIQNLFSLIQYQQKGLLAEQFVIFIAQKQQNQQSLRLLTKMIQSCPIKLMWNIINGYRLLPQIVDLLKGTSSKSSLELIVQLIRNSVEIPVLNSQIIQMLISLNVRYYLQEEYDRQVDSNTLEIIECALYLLNSQIKNNDPKFIGHMKGF